MSQSKRKFAKGEKGGIPPWKEGQNIDLRIAHWCNWSPRLSGMYETTRELIMAENRIEGVLAGFCETPGLGASPQRINKAAEGGRVDPMHPHFRTQDWGWAMKFADIHVVHSTRLGRVGELKPRAFFMHGTVEACLESELEPQDKYASFSSAGGYIAKSDATFVTNERSRMFWSQFDYSGTRVHRITKGIDLNWWNRTSTQQDLNGEPSILYGEVWRRIKHPLHLLYAVNQLYEENPEVRLNIWGCNMKRVFWQNIMNALRFDKFLGKPGLPNIIDYPEHYYSRGDVLASPSIYGDVTRVHQEAMACFPPGTKIQTLTGLKNIESIQLGEFILSHKGRYCPVTQLYKRLFSGYLSRVGVGNSFIHPTPEHPILTEKGWLNGLQIKRSLLVSEKPYRKGRSNLYCWTPRWRRILLHQDPVPIQGEPSRRRIKLSARSGDGTEQRSPLYSGMVESDLWWLHSAQAKQTRGLLASDRKATRGHLHDFHSTLFEDENRISRHSPAGIQQTIEHRRGTQQLSGLVMVSASGRKGVFNQLETQSQKIERFLEAFRPIPITSVKKLRYSGPVYNLGVGFDHSYCANGIIVHNCGCPVVCWDTDPYQDAHPYKYAKAFDPIDLGQKIMDTYSDVLDDREHVAQQCRALAERYFDINFEAQQIVNVLRDVVSEQ